jgi:apolipoprotein N-acyltransferase
MSAFRAVENGHTIVRPVNGGLSAVVSPVGRILGWRSDFDAGPGFLLVEAPTQKLFTLYTLIGGWAILLPMACAALAFLHGCRRNAK